MSTKLIDKSTSLWSRQSRIIQCYLSTITLISFMNSISYKQKENGVSPSTNNTFRQELQSAIDLWENENYYLLRMSPLIGYLIQRGQSWNYIHISNTKQIYQTVFMYVHTCVSVLKKKKPSNWEEVREDMGVVGEQRHERSWRKERERREW